MTGRVRSGAVTVGLIIATVGGALLLLSTVLETGWPLRASCATEACREAREWLSAAITAVVLLAGLFQYRQAQQWKRAEFVAAEMKAFLAEPRVRTAMLMIDWGRRNVNLFESDDPNPRSWPLVTRRVQSEALLPHPIRSLAALPVESALDESSARDSDLASFTVEEVAIRDTYDAFLDGLERFASYVATGLLTSGDLRPYLGYWIDDIASVTSDLDDGEWACSLLAYVAFYRFAGVQALFGAFGHDVTPGSPLFAGFLAQVSDPSRREALRQLLLADVTPERARAS